MKEKLKHITSGLTFRIIFGTVWVIFLFDCIVSAVGYRQFTNSFTQEYQDAANYGSFRSVFSVVGADSGDTPWPVGYEHRTTNEEYRREHTPCPL